VLGCVLGCGGPEAAPFVPLPVPSGASLPVGDAGRPLVSPIPADFRARFAKLNLARFLTRGHLYQRFAVDLYANDAGKEAYLGKVAEAAPGAMIVKEHFASSIAGDGRGPLMAMEKQPKGFDPEGGDWRYLVVTARGEVVLDGKAERCGGCHHEAPRDHLFPAAE